MAAHPETQKDDLTRVQSYSWPTGHFGHLSPAQQSSLDRFKTIAKESGYYVPAQDGTPPSHDDETLLRYLRARKFVPEEGYKQFKATEDWRGENQLDQLYETIDINEYEQTRRIYPQWTGRRDKRGLPLFVFDIGETDAKKVVAYEKDDDAKAFKSTVTTKTPRKMLRLFALYESLCRFVMPLCSSLPERVSPETPISQSSNIVDISGLGFTKFWSLRNHMSDSSKLATAYYPETLDRIFVVGAPSFFPTLWQWAQRWFDPITVSKIYILSPKDMTATLSKFVDVENIPKKYGGKLDWEFGDMPALDPAIANSLRWKEQFKDKHGQRTLPIGPIRWRYDDDGDLVATAIGSENGQPRNLVIAGLHVESGSRRLALSPGRAQPTSTIAGVSGAAQTQSPSSQAMESYKVQSSNNTNDVPAAAAVTGSVPTSSRAGTFTVPYRNDEHDVAMPPVDGREGTSSTRYEQQTGTHAEGQLQDGTPHVKVDGQGERQGIMDPVTVGQAPKEHPLPVAEESGPSIVEKVQDLAGQAYEQAGQLPQTVLSAVGIGSDNKETIPEKTKTDDPEIDNMPGKNVEEFLRHKTMSQPQPPGH